MPRSFFIQTVGCQMNVLDSESIAAELCRAGYVPADGIRRADVVLFNTCSVRGHAEEKVYSALGRLKNAKQRQPRKIIGVLGCMAQKDARLVFRRAPHVDLVLGPGRLHRLTELLERIAAGRGPCLEVSLDRTAGGREAVRRSFVPFTPARPANRAPENPVPFQSMVLIVSGCDAFCSYCVVPRVRGPEQSRPAAAVVDEVRRLADAGCLEVTLLGQAVNSYRDCSGARTVALPDLLGMLDRIEGLRRIKFVTNHPRYMTGELLAAVRDLAKVSPYLHVPAQSGSDAVLRRMNRGYSAGEYREMLAQIRETVPGAAVTSDFIVGFCGETEADFQLTADLVRGARFKNSFIFKYSSRLGTKAAELYADDVPESVKRRRNNELLAIQNAVSLEDNQPYRGRVVEILVEGPSKTARKKSAAVAADGSASARLAAAGTAALNAAGTSGGPHPDPLPKGEGTGACGPHPNPLPKGEGTGACGPHPDPLPKGEGTETCGPHPDPHPKGEGTGACGPHPNPLPKGEGTGQLVGRTVCDRIVVFDGPRDLTGRIIPVRIDEVDAFTLFGSTVETQRR